MKIWSGRKNKEKNFCLIHRMARVKMGGLLVPILVAVASGNFTEYFCRFLALREPDFGRNSRINQWNFELLPLKPVRVTLVSWWIWNSTWGLGEECWNGPTSRYDGTKSTTKSGLTCQDWSLDKPHVPKHRPKDIDMATGKSHNHCR